MAITFKVSAYITNGRRLLVFEHTQHPEAGIQVPGGTIEAGEMPETAIMREVREESGLTNLVIVRYLGRRRMSWVNSDLNTKGVEDRHFFHLHCPGHPAAAWRHWERYPSQGPPDPIEFQFYWARWPEIPQLAGGQGALLGSIDWDSLAD